MGLTIGGKIKLDGEKEYKSAISDLNAALKLHKSELAAIDAEYGKNATSMDALTKKADALDRQFLSQKDKVETLRGALEDATDKYGEADKKTIAYATSLNRAEADLAKMSAELENVHQQLDPLNQSLAKNMSAADDAGKKQALLASELKALDAEYKNNSSSAEYLAKKQELLSEQAHVSQSRVDSLRAALADAAQSAGEDSDEYLNLSKSLNTAKQEMYDAKNAANQASEEYEKLSHSLDDTEDAAKDMGKQSKELADESLQLGDGIGDLASKFGLDLPDGIKKALNHLGETRQSGKEAGGSLTSLAGNMDETSDAGGTLTTSLGDMIGKGSGGGLLGILAPAAAAAAAVVAVGAAMENLSQSSAAQYQDSLASIQRKTGEVSEENKKLVTSLYTENLGDDYADIADAISLVKTALGDLDGVNLETATEQALQLKKAFDVDVQDSVRATSAIMRSFGEDSTTAFDALAYGIQNGITRADDLNDTFIEYAVNAGAMGLELSDLLAILDNGLKNGIRNTDDIADAVREFAVRMLDTGSSAEDVSDALDTLGLNAGEMRKRIAEGGEAGREAFYSIASAVDKVDDSLVKNQIGVTLFGTKFEDTSGTIIEGIGQAKDSVIQLDGALENSQVYGFSDSWENFKRTGQSTIDEFFQPMLELLTPLVDTATNLFGVLEGGLQLVDSVSGGALGTLGEAVGLLGGVLDLTFAVLERGLKEISGGIDVLMTPLSNLLGIADEGMAGATEKMHGFADAIRGTGDVASESGGKVKEVLLGVSDEAQSTGKKVTESFEDASGRMTESQTEAYDEIRDAQVKAFGQMGGAYQEYLKTLSDEGLEKVLKENEKALEENLSFTTDLFTRIKDDTKLSMRSVNETLEENQKDFAEWSDGLNRLAEAGISEGLIKKLRDAGPETKTLVKDMLRGIGTDATPEADKELRKLVDSFEKGGLLAIEKLDQSLEATAPTVYKTVEGIVLDSGRAAAAAVPEAGFVETGENSIGGLIQGVENKKLMLYSTVKSAIYGAQRAARDADQQKSPSLVYTQIGKYNIDGLVKGVKDNAHRYTNIIETTAKSGQKVMSALAGKNAEQVDKWLKDEKNKVELTVFDEIALYTQLAKQHSISIQSREEFEKRSFEARTKLLTDYKELYGLAARDEIAILTDVRKAYEDDGAGRALTNELILEAQQAYLDELSEKNEMTSGDVARYWNRARKQYEDDDKAKIEADREYYEARKKVIEDVAKLEEEYEKEVLSRQQKHAGDVFAGLSKTADHALNAFDMQEAAQKQLQTLEQWTKDIGSLMSRGIDENFVAQVREKGKDSAEEVNVLVNMTDSQLQTYVETWRKNSELARKQAEKELKPLKDSMQAEIKALTKGIDVDLQEIPKVAGENGKAIITELTKALDAGVPKVEKSVKEIKKALKIGADAAGNASSIANASVVIELAKTFSAGIAHADIGKKESNTFSLARTALPESNDSATVESANLFAAYGMGEAPELSTDVSGAVSRAMSQLNQTAEIISSHEGKAVRGTTATNPPTKEIQTTRAGNTYYITLDMQVQASDLKEIQDLFNLLTQLPQAAKARR